MQDGGGTLSASSPAEYASRGPAAMSRNEHAGDGKVPEESVEREAGSAFGVLRSGKTGPFRPRWELRTVKARLAIALGGGQVYVAGRPRIERGNSGLAEKDENEVEKNPFQFR